ncbi:ABC transporter permease [Jannaschia sp. W003]|uniref:ABC transporter permease n=1 Tax=Jannaschia sp. W003 TaxID=2867012 RepID=UPI0021A39EA2|nr:ABC transporter permease [Jannaschia sp. W003]UWQ20921.1 ABC transporter permease [Jannaschia sp. W003]
MQTDTARGLSLISVPFLYAVLLLAGPLLTILVFSFWSQDYLTVDRTPTLENYRAALGEPIYRTLLLRSLGIAGAVTLITVVLAFPVAYYVSFRVHPSKKPLWLFLITIPFWTSYLLRIFLWKVMLGYNGVINSALEGLGLIDEPLRFILYNANAVVITLSHAFAPFAILPIFVALERIDRSLLEAARDLGENAITTFLRVTLPLAAPGVVAALLIVFIPTVGDYITPAQVGGPGGKMIANFIYELFFSLNDRPMGSALAVVAMAAVTVVALAVLWLGRRLGGAR